MDPDELLGIVRKLAEEILAIADEPDYDNGSDSGISNKAYEMAESFQNLDNWIKSGGFVPKDWVKK